MLKPSRQIPGGEWRLTLDFVLAELLGDGLITEGQTASTEAEHLRLLALCAATTAGTGFMHEAFDARDPNRYIRGWCAWNDSQFGALVLSWLSRSTG